MKFRRYKLYQKTKIKPNHTGNNGQKVMDKIRLFILKTETKMNKKKVKLKTITFISKI